MRGLFIDAGAFIALTQTGDQHHEEADQWFRKLGRERLATSFPVLTEVATRGARRIGAGLVARFVRGILDSSHYLVLDARQDVFVQALDLMVKYSSLGVSLTDCTSIVLMRALRIRRIFTFDGAFRRLGFEVIP